VPCHVEPPEKGERAALNPNLPTRLNLVFFDQTLGREVGYCWSIKFATQAQQNALSRYAIECPQRCLKWVKLRSPGALAGSPLSAQDQTGLAGPVRSEKCPEAEVRYPLQVRPTSRADIAAGETLIGGGISMPSNSVRADNSGKRALRKPSR
jgi:hypothetical protein